MNNKETSLQQVDSIIKHLEKSVRNSKGVYLTTVNIHNSDLEVTLRQVKVLRDSIEKELRQREKLEKTIKDMREFSVFTAPLENVQDYQVLEKENLLDEGSWESALEELCKVSDVLVNEGFIVTSIISIFPNTNLTKFNLYVDENTIRIVNVDNNEYASHLINLVDKNTSIVTIVSEDVVFIFAPKLWEDEMGLLKSKLLSDRKINLIIGE